MSEKTERRVKRVKLLDEWLSPLLTGEVTIISNLPDDAVVEDVYRNEVRACLVLKIVSDEFEPVPEGEVIPEHEVEVERVNA